MPSNPTENAMRRLPAMAARFRPHAERLEDRTTPAVDVFQKLHVLYLVGDTAADRAAVADLGGNVIEVRTDRGAESFQKVREVVASLGDGHDAFEFRQVGRPSEQLDVGVGLGAGDDRLLYSAGPADPTGAVPLLVPAAHTFAVRGGGGNDAMVINPCLIPGLDLSVWADLGGGNDSFTATVQGEGAAPVGTINPCWSVAVDAGAGSDSVRVAVGNPTRLAPLCLDEVFVRVAGGSGGDVADVVLDNLTVGGPLSATVNTGGGADAVFLNSGQVTLGGPTRYEVGLGGGDDRCALAVGDTRHAAAMRGPVRVIAHGGWGDDTMVTRSSNQATAEFALLGGAGADILAGAPGGDLPDGGRGDTFSGGLGNDILVGGPGADDLNGGPGHDHIFGGYGDDRLLGGDGYDFLDGFDGDDILDGGEGNDILQGFDGGDLLLGGDGDDRLLGEDHADRLFGGEGVDLLHGGHGDDYLDGGGGDDQLFGSDGGDQLDGGTGSDRLDGGDDDDTLRGGGTPDDQEIDHLRGGLGADLFVVTLLPWADLIIAFNAAEGDTLI
jgi:Ca2+-binding RTX toxin-like protein